MEMGKFRVSCARHLEKYINRNSIDLSCTIKKVTLKNFVKKNAY